MNLAPLQARAGLQEYRKQAKGLVEAFKSGDADAMRIVRQHHPRLPGSRPAGYYDVVKSLVAAGATVDQFWLADPVREMPLVRKIRDDPRMLAALRGEMGAAHRTPSD